MVRHDVKALDWVLNTAEAAHYEPVAETFRNQKSLIFRCLPYIHHAPIAAFVLGALFRKEERSPAFDDMQMFRYHMLHKQGFIDAILDLILLDNLNRIAFFMTKGYL